MDLNRALLETIVSLRTTHSEHPSLLDYVEGMAKAGIGLVKIGKQGLGQAILCHQELREGPLAVSQIQLSRSLPL